MTSSSKNLLFITDPIDTFNPEAETTSFLMREAETRGYGVWQTTLDRLFCRGAHPTCLADRLTLSQLHGRFQLTVTAQQSHRLTDFKMVFLRKDPPVDQSYIYHLQLLTLLESHPEITLVNRPSGILAANEKLLPLFFPDLIPETLITCHPQLFEDFLTTHRDIILKPLNLSGGQGVYRLSADDLQALKIFEAQTKNFTEYQVLQRFLPEAAQGDKRILLGGDEIIGAFLRVPKPGDFRGNMHQGATWETATLRPRDHHIVATLRPKLRELGLFFVGLDIIGDYVTEINCTSPMGIREINTLYEKNTEAQCFDILESVKKASYIQRGHIN